MNIEHGIFFKNKKFLRIHTNELVFDIVLFLYVKDFLYSFISKGERLYQVIDTRLLAIIGVPLMAFFITWYIGFLAARLSLRIKNKDMTYIPTIALYWIMLSMTWLIIQNFNWWEGNLYGQFESWPLIAVMISSAAGFFFGRTEKDVEQGKPVFKDRLIVLIVTLIFSLFILIYDIINDRIPPFFDIPFVWGLFYFSIIAGLIKLYYMFYKPKPVKKKPKRHVSLFYLLFRAYIFPFIVITMLCLWQELYIWGKIDVTLTENKILTIPGMLGYLFITGIIPIRIIMVWQSSVNLLGIVTGLGSISYFFYSIIKLVTNIFG